MFIIVSSLATWDCIPNFDAERVVFQVVAQNFLLTRTYNSVVARPDSLHALPATKTTTKR